MLPIDEDILLSRYGDNPTAARWYRDNRALGLDPREAIEAVERLLHYADGLPFLQPEQVQAWERYASAVADGMAVLDSLATFQPPGNQSIAQLRTQIQGLLEDKSLNPERIRELIEASNRFTAQMHEQLRQPHE
jgi:hypothetical protein